MTSSATGWQAHPDGGSPAELPPVEPGRVVGIGASCDLEPPRPDSPRSQSFSVSEFVTLADGRRVILHAERGFTGRLSSPGDLRDYLTPESITADVLNVVLPDDDEPTEDHPWEWLAGLAQARGLTVTVDDLRGLPYEVILTDKLKRWLS